MQSLVPFHPFVLHCHVGAPPTRHHDTAFHPVPAYECIHMSISTDISRAAGIAPPRYAGISIPPHPQIALYAAGAMHATVTHRAFPTWPLSTMVRFRHVAFSGNNGCAEAILPGAEGLARCYSLPSQT